MNGSASSLPVCKCAFCPELPSEEKQKRHREEECERETQTVTSQGVWKCDGGVIFPPSSCNDEPLFRLLLDLLSSWGLGVLLCFGRRGGCRRPKVFSFITGSAPA